MNKTYKLRSVFVFLFFCLLYAVILFNLYFIQIRQNAFYTNLGKKQYSMTISRYCARAEIFDRTGKQPLALNKDYLSAFILPKQVQQPKQLESFLKKQFPHSLKKYKQQKNKNFMFIQRKLNKQQQKCIEHSNLKDIKLLKERGRFYPVPSTSTIIGATDIDNKGIFGLEFYFNDLLGGTPAVYSLQQEARSGHFYFKKETQQQGKPGKKVTITIDSDLQFLAHEELLDTLEKWNAKEGAIIVMDPKNGDILAMVNAPSWNPNDLSSIELEKTKNKVITESYEFGSIAKAFTALAAIEEGVADINETIDCSNKKTSYVGGRKVNTLVAHGLLSFSEIVEHSNNIGIAIIAQRLNEKLYDHYIKLGFGKKTGIPFPGEQSGFVNPPSKWSKQSIMSLSYGYEMSCTLLQIAQAFCLIARDGCPVTPRLLLSDTKQKTIPLYKKETIDTIKQILENTTLRGTAKRAGIKGYRVMSKTGTANLLVDGQYSPDKNIYTCAGIIQKDNYQRVIVTFVKEAQKKQAYASTVAAPLFEKVAEKIIIHDKIV
ncbi:penicillin-binding protein 2 [bacterium]|nr:penicillin-binding protein 2 [bacterium]